MKREVITTADGSKTIRIIELDENYHSSHGALQEAQHVFIQNGLNSLSTEKEISIFEMGFGTGLNAFLTAIKSEEYDAKIKYYGIEAFPVQLDEIIELDYKNLMGVEYSNLYLSIHQAEWGQLVPINSKFELKKIKGELQTTEIPQLYFDIVYYDAFGPRAQDEMWSMELFQKMYDSIKQGGFLVTYCAKGQVKRDLKSVGFTIEPLPGPPGKREMTRAWKR